MSVRILDSHRTTLEQLSLEQKIGQLFVTGFPGTEPSEEFLRLVKEQKVGNVIFFTYNAKSRQQMAELTNFLFKTIMEETGIMPFITIDEEGGVVSRLPAGTAIMPSPMAQGNLGDEEMIRQGARIAGEQLLSLGVNFNLAPSLDINSNQQNPVIGVRSFGERAEQVCRFASAAIQGYSQAGIMCSGKHFPGHGDTETDSHLSLPVIHGTREELERRELLPFQKMIGEGLPAITIAHIRVPSMEPKEIPATMSRAIISDYLRKELGYDGLIISDCMEMDAIQKCFGIGKGVVEGLRAGIDLIFISHTPAAVKEGIEAVKKALAEGTLSMKRLDDAVSRILEAKKKYAGNIRIDPSQAGTEVQITFAEKFLQKTIVPCDKYRNEKMLLGKSPLFAGAIPSRVTLASSDVSAGWDFAHYMQRKFGGLAITFSMEPSAAEIGRIMEAAKEASSVVIGTLNGHLYQGQKELIQSLHDLAKTNSKKTALIALRNPYDLQYAGEEVFCIPLYEYSVRTMEAVSSYFVQ